MVVAVGLTAWVPLVAFVPVHALEPLAVQLVAFVLLQVSVLEPPTLIVVGLAVNVRVGGMALTTTVAFLETLPPNPVQVSD